MSIKNVYFYKKRKYIYIKKLKKKLFLIKNNLNYIFKEKKIKKKMLFIGKKRLLNICFFLKIFFIINIYYKPIGYIGEINSYSFIKLYNIIKFI
jgi:hypothetical protein